MKQYKIVKTTTKILIGFCVIAIFAAIFATQLHLKADDITQTKPPDGLGPSEIMNVSTALDRGLEFLEYFLGFLGFIGVAIAGIQFGMAGGDATKVAHAKKSLIYVCIGIFMAVLSFAIVQAIFGMIRE